MDEWDSLMSGPGLLYWVVLSRFSSVPPRSRISPLRVSSIGLFRCAHYWFNKLNRHIGCFHILIVVTNIAMYMSTKLALHHTDFVSFGYDCYITRQHISMFWRSSIVSFATNVLIHILISSVSRFLFSYILSSALSYCFWSQPFQQVWDDIIIFPSDQELWVIILWHSNRVSSLLRGQHFSCAPP